MCSLIVATDYIGLLDSLAALNLYIDAVVQIARLCALSIDSLVMKIKHL